MICEYAIEPDVLIEWAKNQLSYKYIADNFGLGKSRMMAEYPKFKNWRKKLRKAWASSDIGDFEEARLTALFSLLTEKKIKRQNYQYNGEDSWLKNAEIENQRQKPFKAIIAKDNPRKKTAVLSNKNMGSWADKYWLMNKSKRISKKAEIIASTVAPMLQNCNQFILIDPYFRASKTNWRHPLELMLIEFLKYRSDLKNIECEIYVSASYDKAPSKEFFEKEFQNTKFKQIMPTGLSLTVKRWRHREGGEKLHDRFILTDIGGILSSYGFDEFYDYENHEQTTSLILLEKQDYNNLMDQYTGDSPEFDLETQFTIRKN